jgi:hypothetical protein
MKNLKTKLVISALLLLIGSAFYFSKTSKFNSIDLTQKNTIKIKQSTLPDKLSDNHILAKTEKLSEFSNFTIDEKKSLLILTSLLNDGAKGDLPKDSFIEDLKELKLKPVVMKDQNEYTGTLNIIRTKDTLPGTRYIHAQYFEDENMPALLQHLSFEFRGGDKAFDLVKKVVQEQLQITTFPVQQSDAFISWRVGKRNVWIKKLNLEDISKDNPFNSYDLKNDVGTIRVAIELEIH